MSQESKYGVGPFKRVDPRFEEAYKEYRDGNQHVVREEVRNRLGNHAQQVEQALARQKRVLPTTN